MATFIVEFDIENAAFEDTPSEECARILRKLAAAVENDVCVGAMQLDGQQITLQDCNGNTVGYARVR